MQWCVGASLHHCSQTGTHKIETDEKVPWKKPCNMKHYKKCIRTYNKEIISPFHFEREVNKAYYRTREPVGTIFPAHPQLKAKIVTEELANFHNSP